MFGCTVALGTQSVTFVMFWKSSQKPMKSLNVCEVEFLKVSCAPLSP